METLHPGKVDVRVSHVPGTKEEQSIAAELLILGAVTIPDLKRAFRLAAVALGPRVSSPIAEIRSRVLNTGPLR